MFCDCLSDLAMQMNSNEIEQGFAYYQSLVRREFVSWVVMQSSLPYYWHVVVVFSLPMIIGGRLLDGNGKVGGGNLSSFNTDNTILGYALLFFFPPPVPRRAEKWPPLPT